MSALVKRSDTSWDQYHRTRRMLGSAAWLPDTHFNQFSYGSIWLGRNREGIGVGIRDDRHILLCSGSRGGKGVSFIIPNLAFWPGSAVVIDPKGENAIVSARRRGNGSAWAEGLGQRVHILDPFNVVKTPVDDFKDLKAAFNPIDLISVDDPESVDTAFRIAEALLPGENSNDPFFDDAAKEFLANIMLHVASCPNLPDLERTLLTVRELIVAGDQKAAAFQAMIARDGKAPSGYEALFVAMTRNTAFNGVVSRAGFTLLDLRETSPRLFGSITQVARTNTRFMDGDSMRRVLARSTFKLADLKRSRRGETLYLCLPQRYMETCFYWFRMMVGLITSEMERCAYRPQSGHPVLMLLDEFAALKRMRVIENAAAQIAGFGVKLAIVVQSLGQLKEHYKDNWETFIANSGVKLFSCNDDHFTREYVSKLIGEEDVLLYTGSESVSAGSSESQTSGWSSSRSSGSSWSMSNGQTSYSANSGTSHTINASTSYGTSSSSTNGSSSAIHKRLLLTPDEVGREFGDSANPKVLVLISGHQPAALSKALYYKEQGMEGTYSWHPDHAQPPSLADAFARRAARARAHAREEEQKRIAAVQSLLQELEECIKAPAAAVKPEKEKEKFDLETLFLLTMSSISFLTLLYVLYMRIAAPA